MHRVLILIALCCAWLAAQQPARPTPADPSKFLTQPLITEHLHRRSLGARLQREDLHLSVARHRRRRPAGRSRQPLRDARLPRALDGRDRRQGHRPRRRARHQGRAVGRPADVGAGRGGEGRQVLPVLPGEGQAGRLPHRRGRWRQARRAVQGAARTPSRARSASTRRCSRTPTASTTCTSAASGAGSCSAGRRGSYVAKDVYPAKDQPALTREGRAPAATTCSASPRRRGTSSSSTRAASR